MDKWKEVDRFAFPKSSENKRIRYEIIDGSINVIEEVLVHEKVENDITENCEVKLVKSNHSSGYYCSILYEGKSILALGLDEKSKSIITQKGIRLRKAPDGTISFNIYKVQ